MRNSTARITYLASIGCACSFCGTQKSPLKRCTGCKLAWYCDRACQLKHWNEHKPTCKLLAKIGEAVSIATAAARLEEYANGNNRSRKEWVEMLVSDGKFSTGNATRAADVAIFRQSVQGILEKMAERRLLATESAIVFNSPVCHVCFHVPGIGADWSLELKQCTKCSLGFACTTCWDDYHQRHEGSSACPQYQVLNISQLLYLKHHREHGERLSFAPEGTADWLASKPPSDWKQYFSWRSVPNFVPGFLNVVSSDLSLPLTTVLGLTELYSKEELKKKTEIVVHIVGAADYEAPPTLVWEEVLHVFPHVRRVLVVFVGPELSIILDKNALNLEMDMGTCPRCDKLGAKRTYMFYGGKYHEYAASPYWIPPTIVMAFNSGIHMPVPEVMNGWEKTVHVMFEKKIPAVFTSYNKFEAKDDKEVLQKWGGEVVAGPKENPFKGLTPYPEVVQGELFYYNNAFYTCVRAAEK